MKKLWSILPLVLLLSGCGSEETMETIADEWAQPVMASPGIVSVQLPEDARTPVMENDTQQVYMGENYEIILETCSSGDLDATIRSLSGYGKDQLTVLETQQEDAKRYDFVWTTAGEAGDRLGRAVILDDGNYHYCLSVLRAADRTKQTLVVWRDVFSSFSLI